MAEWSQVVTTVITSKSTLRLRGRTSLPRVHSTPILIDFFLTRFPSKFPTVKTWNQANDLLLLFFTSNVAPLRLTDICVHHECCVNLVISLFLQMKFQCFFIIMCCIYLFVCCFLLFQSAIVVMQNLFQKWVSNRKYTTVVPCEAKMRDVFWTATVYLLFYLIIFSDGIVCISTTNEFWISMYTTLTVLTALKLNWCIQLILFNNASVYIDCFPLSR